MLYDFHVVVAEKIAQKGRRMAEEEERKMSRRWSWDPPELVCNIYFGLSYLSLDGNSLFLHSLLPCFSAMDGRTADTDKLQKQREMAHLSI